MDIAKSIRMALAREAKTQEWLGSQIGATKATVSNYCKGKTAPDSPRLSQIAEIFGMTVSEFIALGEK